MRPQMIYALLRPAVSLSSNPMLLSDRLRSGSRNRTACLLFACIAALLCRPAISQSVAAPTVLTTFEQQVLSAFNPSGKSFSSVTLNGSAIWTAGSLQETGNVALQAGIDGSTSETWTLPSQSHARTESGWSAGRSCGYTDNKGVAHTDGDPNCRRAVPWFAPWSTFALLPAGTLVGTDVTQATDRTNGLARLTFQTNYYGGVQTSASVMELGLLEKRAAATVTFDQTTALPMAVDFDLILDSDPSHTIKCQIIFSDYRTEAGVVVPHRIQRYIQRTLQADITITSVTVQ